MACELPPCPPCPPPSYPPCPQVCTPPPQMSTPCRSKPVMRGLHWAQTKRKLAQAILLSMTAGAAVYFMGMRRKAAYREYYRHKRCADTGVFLGLYELKIEDVARKAQTLAANSIPYMLHCQPHCRFPSDERGCFEDWADEMARKGLFQSVPRESLKDFD